ncbi:MAG: Na-K-Cl cotransporter [Thermodesulfobacteriota bacterium]|nr:Na-K-Cl cotransporter [Thermodesulfobacteriota bacterium]
MPAQTSGDKSSPGSGQDRKNGGLGTFLGVFTPTILTILGVIMYLRLGWVVGQVGIMGSLLIVLLANSITLATSLSLSAVATNTRVGVGGAYYIISRNLGLEIGGAVGLPLFFSQALSVTLYSFGLAESLRLVWPQIPVSHAAFIIIVLVALLALRGAGAALKAQIPVMVMIVLSLLALGAGVLINPVAGSPSAVPPSEYASFWEVFAVFFPAATGIIAGLSLSGDLVDPRRAIPRGTLIATLMGLAVYLTVPVLLYLGAEPATLRTDPLVWTRIALFGPWLIIPGLWGAIFSSAVGSMLGAPRTLQALSLDRLAPRFLGGQGKAGKEPLWGLFVTLALSLLAVFLGDLNTVATVVTMFFLSVYGIINLVAALERLSGNPSWRPSLNIHWAISLLGSSGCFLAMLLIHWPSTLVAFALEFGLWIWFKHHIRSGSLGDLRRDIYEAIIRWALIRLSDRPMTARNWRPLLLVFVRDIEQRLDLVRFASWFSQDRGVVTVSELVDGDILDVDMDLTARQKHIEAVLHREGILAFGDVNIASSVERGILTVVQANGIAGLESNTILVGFPDDLERLTIFLRVLRRLQRLNRSLIIGKLESLRPAREGKPRIIHVWWGGLKRNSDLMLLLAYLLTCNAEWRDARIQVLSLASNDIMKTQTEEALAKLIPKIRIEADVKVMKLTGKDNVSDIIRRKSFGADVVFLGLAIPDPGKEEEYALRIQNMVDCLPTCFLVHNGSLFIGDLVTPEEASQPDEGTRSEGGD